SALGGRGFELNAVSSRKYSPLRYQIKGQLRLAFFMLLMMYSTYVLYSKSHDRLYIGFSSDYLKRFEWHKELDILFCITCMRLTIPFHWMI
ncbi:MAG: hypothetical protein RLP15_04115, partial [Cryomorphaceae bacterium]